MTKSVIAKPGRPKSEEKRSAIQQAASELFLSRGLKNNSLAACWIAERFSSLFGLPGLAIAFLVISELDSTVFLT